MSVFPQFEIDYIYAMPWETFLYWHRRAAEIKTGQTIEEVTDGSPDETGKVDDRTFQKQKEALEARLQNFELRQQGRISE